MHLQDGIGRGGYRLLSAIFLALGILGLLTTLYAFRGANAQPRGGFFDWLGFGLTFVALAALFGTLLILLQRRNVAPATPAAPAGAPTFTPTRNLAFEFKVDDEPDEDDETGHIAIPVPQEKPTVVLPPNRNIGRDTKGWPQRSGPTGITRGQLKEMQADETPPSPRAPRSVGRAAAMFEPEPSVPVVIARIGEAKDDPNWTPKGMARGKCGGCGAILLAPPERPVRLRCPKCDKETMLR
ncbi:MAG: hypothetical protein V4510_04895 [bacterium]